MAEISRIVLLNMNGTVQEEMAIFNYAMKDCLGVRLTPLAVASQVANGTNYIFICSGTPVVLNPEAKLYAVKVYTHFAHSVAPQ